MWLERLNVQRTCMTANSRWLQNPPDPWGDVKGQVACHLTDFHPCKPIKGKRNVPENRQLQRMVVLNTVWRLGLLHGPVTPGKARPRNQSGSDTTLPLCPQSYSFVFHLYRKTVLNFFSRDHGKKGDWIMQLRLWDPLVRQVYLVYGGPGDLGEAVLLKRFNFSVYGK